LAGQLATLSTEELAKILRVNHRIAATNRLRYSRFHDDAERALPALAAYTGIVFKRIAPADFTAGDFEYAQAHLNITSFLYGLLRPLDAIRTYRLEGDAVLPGHGEQTVFEYWQDKLTDAFLEKIKADDGILVNLASSEMKRLFDWKRICRRSMRSTASRAAARWRCRDLDKHIPTRTQRSGFRWRKKQHGVGHAVFLLPGHYASSVSPSISSRPRKSREMHQIAARPTSV